MFSDRDHHTHLCVEVPVNLFKHELSRGLDRVANLLLDEHSTGDILCFFEETLSTVTRASLEDAQTFLSDSPMSYRPCTALIIIQFLLLMESTYCSLDYSSKSTILYYNIKLLHPVLDVALVYLLYKYYTI